MSELAYGSDKAKDLFRDMMEKANDEYGFEADNIPLMIEAIPMSGECIVLVITKVEDPEELDTRFSKFAPDIDDSEEDSAEESPSDIAEDIVNISDLFKKFKEAVSPKEEAKTPAGNTFRGMAFSFSSIKEIMDISVGASYLFSGTSALYKSLDNDEYMLTLSRGSMDVTDFVQICNMFSEFGAPIKGKSISENYLKEHYETIIKEDAINVLAGL